MFSCREASKALGIQCELENNSILVQGASIDSRSLQPGNLFVAIEGSHVDGHAFLGQAFAKGAAGAIIKREYWALNQEKIRSNPGAFQNIFPVDSPEKALQEIAVWHRSSLRLKAIGVTGSIGKTSTKEFLSYLLKSKHPVHSNQGNFNNQLGLPLTLLQLQPPHQYLVAEIGASKKGDIFELSAMLKPDAGVITQISPAHLKSFGSIKDIYDAKTEIYRLLQPRAPMILPEHDELLVAKAKKYNLDVRTVGYTRNADYFISSVENLGGAIRFTINERVTFEFPGLADFLAYNATLAIAAAESVGCRMEEMPKVWDRVEFPKGRFQPRDYANGIRIIDDSYNANPASVKKALETFSAMKSQGKKFVVLSDMLELGPEEIQYHEDLGDELAKHDFDYILAFGPLSKYSVGKLREKKQEAHFFNEPDEITEFLKKHTASGDQILMKASRGMKMEKIIESFEQHIGKPVKAG